MRLHDNPPVHIQNGFATAIPHVKNIQHTFAIHYSLKFSAQVLEFTVLTFLLSL